MVQYQFDYLIKMQTVMDFLMLIVNMNERYIKYMILFLIGRFFPYFIVSQRLAIMVPPLSQQKSVILQILNCNASTVHKSFTDKQIPVYNFKVAC